VTHYEYNAKGTQVETDLSEQFVAKVPCVCCSVLQCVCKTDLPKQFVVKMLCVCCSVLQCVHAIRWYGVVCLLQRVAVFCSLSKQFVAQVNTHHELVNSVVHHELTIECASS